MNNRKNGFLLFLIGIIIFYIFEGSNLAFIGGTLIVIGFGMITRLPENRELRIYENPKTTENLRHWGYYETIHSSKSHRNGKERKFRVVLKTATGEKHTFLMPETPPKKFFWVNGQSITPEQARKFGEKVKNQKAI